MASKKSTKFTGEASPVQPPVKFLKATVGGTVTRYMIHVVLDGAWGDFPVWAESPTEALDKVLKALEGANVVQASIHSGE